MRRVKQVILVRKDLRMRRGKEIAQGAHAASEFLVSQLRLPNPDGTVELSEVQRQWIEVGMAKVCLRVNSEEELLALHQQAQQQGLVSHLITDSGRTEFGGVPTRTTCAIGPDYADLIDPITGHLTPY